MKKGTYVFSAWVEVGCNVALKVRLKYKHYQKHRLRTRQDTSNA